MKTPKYYTPSVEEFCVGFNYEFDSGLGFNRYTFDCGNLRNGEPFMTFPLNKFRVKCLDDQDIIYCKWKKPYMGLVWELGDYQLARVQIEGDVEKVSIGKGRNILFDGVIKNINELQFIMKSIGIIK